MPKTSKRGRPKVILDWEQIDKLCNLHCTGEEIASFLGVDYDTLQNHCKRDFKINFSEYIRQKSAGGKISLRRRQYSAAMEGNTTMLVWLGKNWLNQTDQVTLEGSVNITQFRVVSDDE